MKRALLIFSWIVCFFFIVLGTSGVMYFSYAFFAMTSHPAVALVLPVFIFVSLVLLVGGISLYFVNRMIARRNPN